MIGGNVPPGVILPGGLPAARAVQKDSTWVDALLCCLLAVYVTTTVCEGPLRWGLALAGVPNLLYLRDAIPTGTLAFLFMRRLVLHGDIDVLIAVSMAVLAFHASIAVMLGVEIFPVLFALKIFVFIPYGMAMWPLLRSRRRPAIAFVWILYATSLAGVWVNGLVGRFPWEAFEYDTMFGTVQTTRLWWAMGESRLPGLARTSYNAAIILGVTGFLAMLSLRQRIVRLVVAALTLLAIVDTTSKGMMVAFSLAAAWLLLASGRPWQAAVGRRLVLGVALVGLALPLLVLLLDVGSSISDSAVPDLLFSLWERFSVMWPAAFELLPRGPAALLGAGLGGIGTPLMYGSAHPPFNPGDSLALYLLVTFGFAGVLYFLVPALLLRRAPLQTDPRVLQACTGVMLMAYGYGVTTNVVEDSFLSIAFGLAMGIACSGLDALSKAPHARTAHR